MSTCASNIVFMLWMFLPTGFIFSVKNISTLEAPKKANEFVVKVTSQNSTSGRLTTK